MTITLPTLWDETIGHLTLKPVLTASVSDELGSCLEKMKTSSDPFLVILDEDQHPAGIYTERDVMNSFIGTNLSKETHIGAIMNHHFISISPNQTIREAMKLLSQNHLNQLPVIESNTILGVLTVEVLLDYLSECFPEELINQPPQRTSV